MDLPYGLEYGIRYFNLAAGVVAMWGLWIAKTRRGYNWTKKMKQIWLSLFLFVFVCVQANVELLYRNVTPTVAAYFTGFILVNVIRHTHSKDGYTVDMPKYEHD